MLSNIASIEIPVLPQSLVEWLQDQPDERLTNFGINRRAIEDRAFYPRLVLGEYLAAQFSRLVDQAREMGVEIHIKTRSTVTDVVIVEETVRLVVSEPGKKSYDADFDYVILATGHQWPANPEIRPGYFTSPWPASALERIRNCAVGIRGSALTAIDAAVTLANQHGEFVPAQDGDLRYQPQPHTDEFSLTMFSRKGILPEADFYHPIPYEPLVICTAEAMQKLIAARPPDQLLDAAFELFRQELTRADREYAQFINLERQTIEEFCAAYFDRRASQDAFEWAKTDLEEAKENMRKRRTVEWRYAILRMHEVFGLLAAHLSDQDFTRFSDTLKTVFVDNYATVPHESIRRLLALHAAGKLFVHQLEEGMRLDTHSAAQGAILLAGDERLEFPAFIEATGQQVSGAKDFPFPSLRRRGVVQDATSEEEGAGRGIAIDGDYHPISAVESSHRLFCLSLPFLLGDHPFAQGITSSAEMADVVAAAVHAAENSKAGVTAGPAS